MRDADPGGGVGLMAKRVVIDHVICRDRPFSALCKHCGAMLTFGYDGIEISRFVKLSRAFIRAHKDCKPITPEHAPQGDLSLRSNG